MVVVKIHQFGRDTRARGIANLAGVAILVKR
jgi:hypothetical protein